MVAAPHPGRVGLELGTGRARVQPPPATPPRPDVVPRAAPPADPAPVALPLDRPHMSDQRARILIELDPLDYRLLAPEQTPP